VNPESRQNGRQMFFAASYGENKYLTIIFSTVINRSIVTHADYVGRRG